MLPVILLPISRRARTQDCRADSRNGLAQLLRERDAFGPNLLLQGGEFGQGPFKVRLGRDGNRGEILSGGLPTEGRGQQAGKNQRAKFHGNH